MAMFENFPYTDMHNLNLDWIIKIAKDFLDQYTHIQQLISDGETSLQNLTESGLGQLQDKADELEALLEAWYDTHSNDIANQLANAVADLNQVFATKLAAFNTQADAKLNETLDSIPSDYTMLALLEKEIPDIIVKIEKDNMTGSVTTGKAISSTNTENAYSTAEYIEYSVSPDDIVYISGYHFSNQYPLFIALNNTTVVESFETTGAVAFEDHKYLVPAGVNKIKVNGSTIYKLPILSKYGEKTLNDAVYNGCFTDNSVLHDSTKIKDSIKTGSYISNTNTEGTLSNALISECSVTPGDVVYINGYHWSNPAPAFIVLDANDTVLFAFNTSGTKYIFMERYEVPPTAAKIKVNGRNEAGNVRHYTGKNLAETLYNNIPLEKINVVLEDITQTNKHTGYAITTSLAENSIATGDYYMRNVVPGEKLIVRGYHWSNQYPAYMLVNDSTVVFAYTRTGLGDFEEIIEIPEGVNKIYVNGHLSAAYRPAYAGWFVKGDLFYNKKRRILFIGDSYASGYTHDTQNDGWCVYCRDALKLTANDVVISDNGGARMSTANSNNFTKLIPTIYKPDYFTDIVVAGGFNDHSNTEEEIVTGLQNFYNAAHGCYPNARIHVGMIAWIKQGSGTGALENWQEINSQLTQTVLKAYMRCDESNMQYMSNVEYWINNYGLSDSDGYHPNEVGNQRLGRSIANAILAGSAPIPYKNTLRI